ncbi:peptide/nickel transport system permease protein/oligopeptide transport system permease protein [Alkalibaculum bacchi]|uniref:Peptide/nickel transport system permease protein/oligopeptide transport system permease protein n=1 Tax=Alkalibaculum bacchi TaxID=645887 RepID=A0A366IHK9_9FIRM|nr:ABC transporter permease [Alkalibaculum bacchi]RBP69994.1 peptide/nickel transport system permease protein/oligopeptide transport system permease protein [Alkalibaculum bacchi]
MTKYLIKRIGLALVTIWAVITITFMLMHSIPGNPFRSESKMPPAVYENLQAKYGLDKPVSEQYVIYLQNLLKGDLGDSMKSRVETVNDMVSRGFPVSAQLGLQALLIAIVFGPALGVLAALYQNKFPDYISMIIAIIGISVPSFIMGTLLIQFVARNVSFFPIGGWGTWRHSLLPSFAMALMPLATMARLMRSSMLEVLGQDYIKTARSKGIAKSAVILKHAVRNAILPVISILGTTISNLLVGSFVIEKIFGIPGLGRFFVQSISNRDYTLIMGTTIFYAAILIVMLLIVDIAYMLIDPRIKLTKEGR